MGVCVCMLWVWCVYEGPICFVVWCVCVGVGVCGCVFATGDRLSSMMSYYKVRKAIVKGTNKS